MKLRRATSSNTAMKYIRLFPLLLIGLLAGSLPALAQNEVPAPDGPQDERQDGRRPNLLAELGLSPEQIQQIKRINQARRPIMMEAQRRMRIANRELDAAIYRDSVSDEEFQARLKELQAAQADLARLRFESELSVRKILTPEQLVRFRGLRRNFTEARQDNFRNRRLRRNGQGVAPMREMPPRRPLND